jgi:acyl-CoA hydrolase
MRPDGPARASQGRGQEVTVHAPRLRLDAILSSAKSIYLSGTAAEIPDALKLLRRHRPTDATVTGIFTPPLNRRSYADPGIGLRMRAFFLLAEVRQHVALGLVDYCPWRYGAIHRWMVQPRRFDTALVMLSPPDADGMCSLGVQTDFLPRFHQNVGRIIGFINPNMPRTCGEGGIPYRALAAVAESAAPLNTLAQRPPDPTAERIAERIAALVPDRATVQMGIGQIPSQVLAKLRAHRGLRIHSGVVDDNVLALEESGALDRDAPIVTGAAVGTPRIYAAVADNSRFSFRAAAHTHAHGTIAGLERFRAINSVLQVDLFGQVSAESSDGRLVATPGGLPDFARGALDSEGGRSIVAVRARNAGGIPNGIVAMLGRPGLATSGAVDADIVVTEFGVADIRELPLDARAEALIAIAAPEDQEDLARTWAGMRAGFLAKS